MGNKQLLKKLERLRAAQGRITMETEPEIDRARAIQLGLTGMDPMLGLVDEKKRKKPKRSGRGKNKGRRRSY